MNLQTTVLAPLNRYTCSACGTLLFKAIIVHGSIVEHKCKCGTVNRVTASDIEKPERRSLKTA